MRQIKIADLKARLSEHLRAVRGGETIAVLDRDTPVAHIVPIRAKHTLRVRKPTTAAPPIHKVALPGPAGLDLDIVHLLLEERQSQR